MGEEIATHCFSDEDFAEYTRRLARETSLLEEWFAQDRFGDVEPMAGFEIETCLIDRLGRPQPKNEQLLKLLESPLVVSELAAFNIEINSKPRQLRGDALSTMQGDLGRIWRHCNECAGTLDTELLIVGILPTIKDGDLTLANMSSLERYRALNEQVLRLRRGRPITLDIHGRDHLRTVHNDVMLESAATSFQIHLQVSGKQAVRAYNAAVILSAPMVALSANSPYLFGHELWDETRVPLFEQAVSLSAAENTLPRVTLGGGYVRASLFECFKQNFERYAVLLPVLVDESADKLPHLRLHNGTIWRWNRPLVGFNDDGSAHLRIEHRVMPAGPTLVDVIANAAIFFGLMHSFMLMRPAPESILSFTQAQENFYAAAKNGLRAEVVWYEGRPTSVRQLLREELLPLARAGLKSLGLAASDIALYLGIIDRRLETGQNGAAWQCAYVAKHQADMQELTQAYRERQRQGAPVHEWSV